jgi:hypothetical protein
MEKREAELKAAFSAALRQAIPPAIMLQFLTAGAPDRAVAWAGTISLWEMKHGTPNFESPGLQSLVCARLAAQGIYCRYVIWQETSRGDKQRTLIVHPKIILERTSPLVEPEESCGGFDMVWLVEHVRRIHGR